MDGLNDEDGLTDRTVTSGTQYVPVPRPAPDSVIVTTIDGVPVAVADVGGVVHAFDDTCTHRECPLSEGEIDANGVVCPCHKSRFEFRTGAPSNGPARLPIRVRTVRAEGETLLVEA